MDRSERFYKIDQLLAERRVVPLVIFLETLEVSRATFKRDLEYLRDRFNAPIVWDAVAGGYRYSTPDPAAPRYSLPGLWFNASEIHALLTMQALLHDLQPGLLGPHIEPLLARLGALIEGAELPAATVAERIKVLRHAARSVPPSHFEPIANALLRRQRLDIVYYHRERDQQQSRQISPQRLVHYRDNWYLDAWCHWRQGLRSFALDAITAVCAQNQRAEDLEPGRLDRELGAGYGIFSGPARQQAVLRFSATRARWVAGESWHPLQSSLHLPDGGWQVSFPYSDDRELAMDILRHGPEVEVIAPPELRRRIAQLLQDSLRRYADELE